MRGILGDEPMNDNGENAMHRKDEDEGYGRI
jgi:hypothetical protein